jgi:DNA-binding LacI/PurR family transcriptional regulator
VSASSNSSSSHSKKTVPRIHSTAEFAKYVGLARTTVSRVLNNQPGLKQATVKKVRQAIEETGFTPNAYALHLKGKKTATVGICMENLLTPPVVRKLARLQQKLKERGYSSLIEVLEPGNSKEVCRHFLSLRVDAIVFVGHFIEEEIAARVQEFNAQGTPHVIIDQLGVSGANTVTLNRTKAMKMVFEHLIRLGHKRFGLLGLSGNTRSIVDRLSGIETVLSEHKLSKSDCIVSYDSKHIRKNDFEYGRSLASSFALGKNLPTAYAALNDEIAIGALHGFQDEGFKIPDDLSIVGFNNQDICTMPRPHLTSVDQAIETTVDSAVKLLLDQIDNLGLKNRTIMIDPELVIRDSSASA